MDVCNMLLHRPDSWDDGIFADDHIKWVVDIIPQEPVQGGQIVRAQLLHNSPQNQEILHLHIGQHGKHACMRTEKKSPKK